MIQARLELNIYRTRGEHANQLNNDAVNISVIDMTTNKLNKLGKMFPHCTRELDNERQKQKYTVRAFPESNGKNHRHRQNRYS